MLTTPPYPAINLPLHSVSSPKLPSRGECDSSLMSPGQVECPAQNDHKPDDIQNSDDDKSTSGIQLSRNENSFNTQSLNLATSLAMPSIRGRCRKPSVASPQAVIDRCCGVKSCQNSHLPWLLGFRGLGLRGLRFRVWGLGLRNLHFEGYG